MAGSRGASKLFEIIAQFETAGTEKKTLRQFRAMNKEELRWLQCVASLIAYVDRDGYEQLEGSYNDGWARYLHYDGIRDVTFVFPGATGSYFGPVELTTAQVRKFKKCIQQERKDHDDSWRDDLEREEAHALMVYEAGGEVGREYYYMDECIEPAEETEIHIGNQIDCTPAMETWEDLPVKRLESLVERFNVELIPVETLPEYFELIKDSVTA